MRQLARRLNTTLVVLLLAARAVANGDVESFCDREAWIDAVDTFETIDFTGYKSDTRVTDQFESSHGTLFTDGLDFITHSSTYMDGAGLRGYTTTTVAFATPRHWLGVDYHGALEIEIYMDGEFVSSSQFCGCCNLDGFGGISSPTGFNEAIVIDWIDNSVHIDNIHIGPVYCPADTDDDADVDVDDLVAVIVDWGCTPGKTACRGDVDHDGDVDVDDLTAVILAWGQCPAF